MDYLYPLIGLAAGIVLTLGVIKLLGLRTLNQAKQDAGLLLDKAKGEANTTRKQVELDCRDELAKRRAAWSKPAYKASRGTLWKYIKNVKSASEGCVTDE